MYKVYLTNHGYEKQDDYTSFVDAVRAAKQTSFECGIYHRNILVASWGPISGLKQHYPSDSIHYV